MARIRNGVMEAVLKFHERLLHDVYLELGIANFAILTQKHHSTTTNHFDPLKDLG